MQLKDHQLATSNWVGGAQSGARRGRLVFGV